MSTLIYSTFDVRSTSNVFWLCSLFVNYNRWSVFFPNSTTTKDGLQSSLAAYFGASQPFIIVSKCSSLSKANSFDLFWMHAWTKVFLCSLRYTFVRNHKACVFCFHPMTLKDITGKYKYHVTVSDYSSLYDHSNGEPL